MGNLPRWLSRLVGGQGDPHKDYYSPLNGYWIRREVYCVAHPEMESALADAIALTNDGIRRAGVSDMAYHLGTEENGDYQLEVVWDDWGYVAPGNTGHTKWYGGDGKIAESVAPPGTQRTAMSATPFFISRVVVYVRRGTKGKALTDLLKHEIWTHANGLQHSPDKRDVSHPQGASVLSAADVETLRMTYQRMDRPRADQLPPLTLP